MSLLSGTRVLTIPRLSSHGRHVHCSPSESETSVLPGRDLPKPGAARRSSVEGAMSMLTWSPVRNQQEDHVAVCFAGRDGGPGSGFPVEIQQQTSTLLRSRLRRTTEYIQQHLDKDLTLAELAAVRLHEPLPFRATLQMQHGRAAPPIRGPATNCPRPRIPGDAGVLYRTDLAAGGIQDPESLHHGVPPRHGHHAERIPNGKFARRPARPGRRVR